MEVDCYSAIGISPYLKKKKIKAIERAYSHRSLDQAISHSSVQILTLLLKPKSHNLKPTLNFQLTCA